MLVDRLFIRNFAVIFPINEHITILNQIYNEKEKHPDSHFINGHCCMYDI